jgi:hypothetical protein
MPLLLEVAAAVELMAVTEVVVENYASSQINWSLLEMFYQL